MQHLLRRATLLDRPELDALIARSIRTLGAGDYTSEQIEGALKGAFGVDTQLILDGTYFVAEQDGHVIGCGGWSYRRTLFGGDSHEDRDAGVLDPAIDAAKIRAFFVDPRVARRGIGASILSRCEAEAIARGFHRFELMATLPGVRLYAARGYTRGSPIAHQLSPNTPIQFVPMTKELDRATVQQAVHADSPPHMM